MFLDPSSSMAIPIQIILLIVDGVAHRMHSLQSSPFPQKELFSASTNLGGTVEGVPDGGPRCCHHCHHHHHHKAPCRATDSRPRLDRRARIQFGQVHFGVFRISRFAPPAFCSDWILLTNRQTDAVCINIINISSSSSLSDSEPRSTRNLALTVHLILVFRDRKLSTSSTGNMKSKWVNAFKNIKGKQEAG